MHCRPLHDRVLVRRIDAEEKPPAASSFPTPQRRSRKKARSSPQAPARGMSKASWSRSM
jgi:co-chaperonin GroES (HSP10)